MKRNRSCVLQFPVVFIILTILRSGKDDFSSSEIDHGGDNNNNNNNNNIIITLLFTSLFTSLLV